MQSKDPSHNSKFPPQAQACSLCPIHNSQFSPRPTRPTRPTIQNSEFKILSPPLAQACSLCPIITFIHIVAAISKSPSQNKTFWTPSVRVSYLFFIFGKDSKIITNSKHYLGATLVLSWCYLGAIFILRLSMTFDC